MTTHMDKASILNLSGAVAINTEILAATNAEHAQHDPDIANEAQHYLEHYGYLAVSTGGGDANKVNSVSQALGRLQKQMGLRETGVLDKDSLTLMTAPRCGVPDQIDPIGAIATGPWTKRTFTYSFGTLTSQLVLDVAKGAVRSAFHTWESAGVGLSFAETSNQLSADIVIEWRSSADSDNRLANLNIAHSDLPPGYSLIVQYPPLPLHFKEPGALWVTGQAANAYDLESVALHEIGHCLGLLHSDDPSDVMYATVFPNTTKRALSANDLAAIRLLYP